MDKTAKQNEKISREGTDDKNPLIDILRNPIKNSKLKTIMYEKNLQDKQGAEKYMH